VTSWSGRRRPAHGPELTALQAALAAEQAACYGYGVVGAHLAATASLLAEATACWTAHQRARDELEQLIIAAGGSPAPAAAAYQLPVTVRSETAARALAVRLESGVASAYLGLVALGSLALRRFGAVQMQQSAVRSARWNGRPAAFPGLPPSAVSSPGRARRAP
jgi:Domain of unknown function (DUF4439)